VIRRDVTLDIHKAGVTREQIEKYRLPSENLAKEKSSNFRWFVSRNGGDSTTWELEALDPKDMLSDLDRVIRSVLDIDLFNAEVKAEREEAPFLEASKRTVRDVLKGPSHRVDRGSDLKAEPPRSTPTGGAQ
jgi:hypothetical protein